MFIALLIFGIPKVVNPSHLYSCHNHATLLLIFAAICQWWQLSSFGIACCHMLCCEGIALLPSLEQLACQFEDPCAPMLLLLISLSCLCMYAFAVRLL